MCAMEGNLVLIGAGLEKGELIQICSLPCINLQSHTAVCERSVWFLEAICCKEVAFYFRFEFSGMVTSKITLTCKQQTFAWMSPKDKSSSGEHLNMGLQMTTSPFVQLHAANLPEELHC